MLNSTEVQFSDYSGMLDAMVPLVDTHAHLCDPAFDCDLVQVIESARQAGLSGVVSVAEDLKDSAKNLELAARYRLIYPAAGLYPTILDMELAKQVHDLIRKQRDKLVAIGEVGLDYWKVQAESDREIQRQIFRGFIALSQQLDLPINVHSRSAGRQAIHLLLEAGARKVQMHAFDGKARAALPAVEAGFFFSIPPSVLRSEQKRKLVKALPLSSLLVETDSPVLGPMPQERNQPANALLVVKTIAELKGIREDRVIEAISENTLRLYGEFLS